MSAGVSTGCSDYFQRHESESENFTDPGENCLYNNYRDTQTQRQEQYKIEYKVKIKLTRKYFENKMLWSVRYCR